MRTAIALYFISLGLAQTTSNAAESEAEAMEARNLEKAIYCMELLELEKDLDTFCLECLGETYIQHTPWLADGKEALIEAFENKFEKYPEFTIEIKRAGADGDLVWIHLNSKREPSARGNAVVNIFRMKDGKFVEHWNVVQAVPEESMNQNSMF